MIHETLKMTGALSWQTIFSSGAFLPQKCTCYLQCLMCDGRWRPERTSFPSSVHWETSTVILPCYLPSHMCVLKIQPPHALHIQPQSTFPFGKVKFIFVIYDDVGNSISTLTLWHNGMQWVSWKNNGYSWWSWWARVWGVQILFSTTSSIIIRSYTNIYYQ